MDKSDIIEKYTKAFKLHGDSDSSVFYPKSRQYVRYKNMLKHISPNKTILDFGCGLAKLYQYLSENYPASLKNYFGVDIVPDFIAHNKEKYSQKQFQLIESVTDVQPARFDIVFSSGAFNMIYGNNIESHISHVQEVLAQLFDITKDKLVVDFMHDDVDFIQDGAFHVNIESMTRFIESKITKRYIIDRSYMPFEVSFTLYKEAHSNNGVYLEGC